MGRGRSGDFYLDCCLRDLIRGRDEMDGNVGQFHNGVNQIWCSLIFLFSILAFSYSGSWA